jgi:hypothetical protein
MTTYTRTTHPNLANSLNSTPEDREMAILLVAYPGRMRLPEVEDFLALMDFIFDGNTGFPGDSEIPERGEGMHG